MLTANNPSPQLLDLVKRLGGRWHGTHAMCRCPAHVDREPSLSIRQGDRGLLVRCFAGCDPKDVLRAIDGGAFPGTDAPLPTSDYRAAALDMWHRATPLNSAAMAYLAGRNLADIRKDIRSLAACPRGRGASVTFSPAIIAALRSGANVVAIQRIFIDTDRPGRHRGKAALGRLRDAAWQGYTPCDTLAIAEGIETAIAYRQLTGTPCWATLGAERLSLIAIPPTVTRLIIAADNGGPGVRLARAAQGHWSTGIDSVRCHHPPSRYADWADVVLDQKGEGEGER